MSQPLYKKGQRAYCKSCHDLLFVMAKDVYFNDLICEAMFVEGIGQEFRYFDILACRSCGREVTESRAHLFDVDWR